MENPTPENQPQPQQRGFSSIRRRLFGPLLATLMMLRLVLLLAGLLFLIPFRMDLTFPEGALAARALDVANGVSPYHDWRQWPHAFAPYPPLTYYSAGWIARAVNPHPDIWTAYFAGRSFCFIMVLGIMALDYLFGRRLGLSRLWSLIAVSALGGSLDFLVTAVGGPMELVAYCTSYRPDAPKTFFALLALWFMMRPRPSRIALAGALASLYISLWFKPTAWAIGIVLGIWVWRNFGGCRAVALGVGFAAAGLLPLWLLDRHWHGLLLLNIVDSLRNGFTISEVANLFLRAPVLFKTTLILGSVLALAALRDPARRPLWPLLAAVPLSFAISLAQMMKIGADNNYLMESFVLSTVLLVAWIARLWQGTASECGTAALGCAFKLRNVAQPPSAVDLNCQNVAQPPSAVHFKFMLVTECFFWIVVIPAILFFSFFNFSTVRDDFYQLSTTWKQTPIEREARAAGGPILATFPFVDLAGAEPTILDNFQFSILCRRGMLSPEPLLERLRRREFKMIVISGVLIEATIRSGPAATPIYCTQFQPVLDENYQYVGQMGRIYSIWRPRS